MCHAMVSPYRVPGKIVSGADDLYLEANISKKTQEFHKRLVHLDVRVARYANDSPLLHET